MRKSQPIDWQANLTSLKERLPRIDRTERIMAEVRSRSRAEQSQLVISSGKKPGRMGAWRISLIVAAVLFACGFGYAMESWKLFAPDGSVALEYRGFMPGDESVDEVDTGALRSLLAEGEAAVFYLKDQNRYIGLANERQYTDFSQFAAEIDRRKPLNELGNGFVFQSGSLVHDLKWKVTDEKDWADSTTFEEFSYRTIPLGEITGYYASYENDRGDKVSLSVWTNVPDRTILTDEMNELEMEKVQIGAREVFYLKGRDGPAQRLAWGEGEGNQYAYYRLDDLSAEKMPQERLIEIASVLIGE
ncbi:hypothetical protein [Cohnella sp.]|uniref:hypothetical protein n=1 Tax=Cohnella sp. TaxID=1883426 RepID=UPI00370411C8